MQTQDFLRLAADDFACYAVTMRGEFELAAHHEVIVSRLEAVEHGYTTRQIICMPPRHGKSYLATELFPAFYLGRNPKGSIIITTYEQEIANDFGRRVRRLVSNPLQTAIFPGCELADDSTSFHRFNTTAGGSFYAVGRGGPLTGRGADLLIIDDPLKNAAEARSATIRRALFEWYCEVVRTRLQSRGAIVLISTRWHEDDLVGQIQSQARSEPWNVLSLAAIAERDEDFRREGEALWPERYPLSELEKIRSEIGSAAFISLYQQRPSAAEGTIFRREWWRTYREHPTCTRIIQSWDTGFKSGCDNDYSVCTVWGVNSAGYFLLWLWRGRVEFPELKRRVAWLAAEWKPNVILIEDRASGQSLIQELKLTNRLPIVPVKVDRDKITRAHAVTPLIEAGKVFLPESAPFFNSYVDETAMFPNGINDDQVDSTTQALNYCRYQQEDEIRVIPVHL